MDSFWQKLQKPFFVLAPMADVTDAAFRPLIASKKSPDVTWTEFVSADGLYYTREVKKIPDAENPLMRDLQYSEAERPIVAQLFTSNPEHMRYAAELVSSLGYDGVDINMGCPDRSIEKQGCGSAMIKTPELVKPIVDAAREGANSEKAMEAREAAGFPRAYIPVSIKTRVGYNTEIIDTWIPNVLVANPDALTVHLRTRKEMSKVPAHWDYMPRVVALRDQHAPHILILGNGDVQSLADAKQKVADTGADGIMLGRAIFGNPWLFTGTQLEEIPLTEKVHALVELGYSFEKLYPSKSFSIFKKHIKAFLTGFDGASELRAKLMECTNAAEIASTIQTELPGV